MGVSSGEGKSSALQMKSKGFSSPAGEKVYPSAFGVISYVKGVFVSSYFLIPVKEYVHTPSLPGTAWASTVTSSGSCVSASAVT